MQGKKFHNHHYGFSVRIENSVTRENSSALQCLLSDAEQLASLWNAQDS